MYKLRFCTSCNLYKQLVQVATCTGQPQLVQVWDLYKLQLVQASYLSVEQCIIMKLNLKIHEVNRSDVHE